MRGCGHAALGTSLLGAPYASLALVAADLDASPLLLLSDLARHSRNIAFDPRVSLLFDGTDGRVDRLDGPRLTVLGRAEAVDDGRLLARFMARHPSSAAYAGFADFRMYRITVERGHLVAGFGRIEWIAGADLLFRGELGALGAAEPALLARINGDPGGMAALLPSGSEDGWQITGIDPEGVDLGRNGEHARFDFARPVLSAEAALKAFAELADQARR